jgi:hypothetical protein
LSHCPYCSLVGIQNHTISSTLDGPTPSRSQRGLISNVSEVLETQARMARVVLLDETFDLVLCRDFGYGRFAHAEAIRNSDADTIERKQRNRQQERRHHVRGG